MKTRFWVLTGLGVAAAATAAFLATERGKKWRGSVASSLDEWRNNLTHLAKSNLNQAKVYSSYKISPWWLQGPNLDQ